MNKSEREELLRLARQRAKVAKTKADEREKVLLAETEDLLAGEFEAEDRLWAEAVRIADEVVATANATIADRCAELGIPANHAPRLELAWRARSPEFRDPGRRAELRRVARTRLTALTTAAKSRIDEQLLETQTALLAGSLESGEAREFLERMPSPEEMMPALGLDGLGVQTWQPPEGAASMLVSPSTTGDRKRRRVLRAIEANPGASNRAIAQIAGVDHKTVAAYRRDGEPGGELPSWDGEFPAEGGELPTDDGGVP